MSDANDQMGGERSAPEAPKPSDREREVSETFSEGEDPDEASKESFPASDPPSTY